MQTNSIWILLIISHLFTAILARKLFPIKINLKKSHNLKINSVLKQQYPNEGLKKKKKNKKKQKKVIQTQQIKSSSEFIQNKTQNSIYDQQIKINENFIQKKQTPQQTQEIQEIQKIKKIKKQQQKNQNQQIRQRDKCENDDYQTTKKQLQEKLRCRLQQIELLKSYFLNDLQQIIPISGKYGLYRLNLEYQNKVILFEWNYDENMNPILKIKQNNLNKLLNEQFQSIKIQKQQNFKNNPYYNYIYEFSTTIYQQILIPINCYDYKLSEEISQINIFLKKQKQQQIKIKQQLKQQQQKQTKQTQKIIYTKLVQQIFYLNDLRQKPQPITSTVKQTFTNQTGTRGRYFKQFQQLQIIGQGGFGKVYKVKHRLDGNIYAVKKTIFNSADPQDKKMLKQVSLLSKLNHPNIVRYYNSWLQNCNSIEQAIEDMDFSSDIQKAQQLKEAYKKWESSRSGQIKFVHSKNNDSSSSSQAVYYQPKYQDQQFLDIDFQHEDSENKPQQWPDQQQSQIKQKKQHSYSQSHHNLTNFPIKILYIVMQLCSGINMRQLINNNQTNDQQKIGLVRGLLQGLAYIHSKKIIHRDLKPANIFLTDALKVKIGDFGLATSQQRSSLSFSVQSQYFDPFNDKTKAVGTGFYRAPQQLKSTTYNEKVDIYSLGVILVQLYYSFNTNQQRVEVLKQITKTHQIPAQFPVKSQDIVQSIQRCLLQSPDQRPSAVQLLNRFRNKYFIQLVSCIANPKNSQFFTLLQQLFSIKNQAGVPPLFKRDQYVPFAINKLNKIYNTHGASFFPTLPFLPVQDYTYINNLKINLSRKKKFLMLSNKGAVLQINPNGLRQWLRYARQFLKKQPGQILKRYTFQRTVQWESKISDDVLFQQKMVTAFDISYCRRIQEQFQPFLLCEAIIVSQQAASALSLTQRKPPTLLSHTVFFSIFAYFYKLSEQQLLQILINLDQNNFKRWTISERTYQLQSKKVPSAIAKKLAQLFQYEYESYENVIQKIVQNDKNKKVQYNKNLDQIIKQKINNSFYQQLHKLENMNKKYLKNPIKWIFSIPPIGSQGFFWETGPVKGFSSTQQLIYGGILLINYHMEMNLGVQQQQFDVAILYKKQEVSQQDIHKLLVQCWRQGITAYIQNWSDKKQIKANISITVKCIKQVLHIKVNKKDVKDSVFIPFDQFVWSVLKPQGRI